MSKNKAIYAGVIAFFVALVILALYGIFSHREAGLLQVQWGTSTAVYNKKEGITIPLEWEKSSMPLVYCLENFTLNEEKHYGPPIDEALSMWNRELGCQVFKKGGNLKDTCTVKISYGLSTGGNAVGASTFHYGGPHFADAAEIVFTQFYESKTLYLIAAHEAGHVLGLAHDDFKRSIMFPIVEEEDPNSTQATMPPLPTSHDLKLLQYLCP